MFAVRWLQGPPLTGAEIRLFDRSTGERKTLIRGASHAEYVEPGFLVVASGDTLRAVRFNADTYEVLSDPVAVIEGVAATSYGASAFATTKNGSLIYLPGRVTPVGSGGGRTLAWVTRQGRMDPIKAAPPTRLLQPEALARQPPPGDRHT